MRTIFVLFDSLNRLALGAYGSKTISTPNFDRFAQRAVTFDNHYAGSMPCMPARRDLHTGRLNFMHRSWGPLEPYDNSFAEILKTNGVHTHLITDHLHYFEDGGGGFHTRFSSYDFIRGQEYDPWVAMVDPPVDKIRERFHPKHYDASKRDKRFQHALNCEAIVDEEDFPGVRCFKSGFEFLDRNKSADDWFLMLECFDPHEPFHAPERFKRPYDTGFNGGVLDWPFYARVDDSPEEIAEIKANYAALVAMCDEYFGKLLDYMDANDMWTDTCLILSTDHGFLLSEHEWWGKSRTPYYEELTHLPLIFHHPDLADAAGTRRQSVTQTPDLMPTFLDIYGIAPPEEVRAHSLMPVLGSDEPVRDAAMFAMFGGPIGIADGTHVLYHYASDMDRAGLVEYTLAPGHMTSPFTPEELRTARLVEPFDFTKGIPLLAIDALPTASRPPNNDGLKMDNIGTCLFDLRSDPQQMNPIRDSARMGSLYAHMTCELEAHDTPPEVYRWYELQTDMEEVIQGRKP